jgi:hypothetical protein
MNRAMRFAVGVTLVSWGLGLFGWILGMDPRDNRPLAVLLGSALWLPGSFLIGRAIWPSENEPKP